MVKVTSVRCKICNYCQRVNLLTYYFDFNYLKKNTLKLLIDSKRMFEAMCNHLKYAGNKGNIRSAITIFRQRTEVGHDFR